MPLYFMHMKNPGKSRNLLGFSPIYTIKGMGEISRRTNKGVYVWDVITSISVL